MQDICQLLTGRNTSPAFANTVAAKTTPGFLERPGCRVYYEVTGSGPVTIFAHGIGSNHLTWWQQVANFSSRRNACIAFSHRGYPPGSEIGVPDPREFAGDLAVLIERLQLADVHLVAQSMCGFTSMEYLLNHSQPKVGALVLTSTSGSIDRSTIPLTGPRKLSEWEHAAAAARADMQHRGISPPAGERMAREQPELHFLYRAIANASASFDREALRERNKAMCVRSADVLRSFSMPTLFITGEEDVIFPPFIADGLASLMPNATVEHVPDTGHSVYFERAPIFNNLLERLFTAIA